MYICVFSFSCTIFVADLKLFNMLCLSLVVQCCVSVCDSQSKSTQLKADS